MYTISEAAERAGLSVDVLRAWERRYGVIRPRRTAAGYRLYDAPTIERLRAMRRLVDAGWTPSAAAASLRDVADADLTAAAPSEVPHPPPDASVDGDDLTNRFVLAAGTMDASALQSVLDEMGARASFETTVERYLFPALHALGDAWQSGEVSVAAEHAASAAAARWMGAAYDAAGPNTANGHAVLVGLPAGVRHELGALAHATAARRAGLPAIYLGADLPAAEWVRAARATGASAALIGVPTPADRDAARTVARSLRRAIPQLEIAFGGAGARSMRGALVLPEGIGNAIRDLAARLSRRGPPA